MELSTLPVLARLVKLIFDVRFLVNPHYNFNLKNNNEQIINYWQNTTL